MLPRNFVAGGFMRKIKYDLDSIQLRECIKDSLGISGKLEDIHNSFNWGIRTRETDQITPLHKMYYDNFEYLVSSTWEKFILEVIAPEMEEDFLYQRIPTFRVQLPGNLAVGEFHRDSEYGHQNGAVNIFIPFTELNKYNTILVETVPDSNEYLPMLCDYGEVYMWDGVNNKHGNVLNSSKVTRVSIDARVVPVSVSHSMPAGKSINMETPLAEGGYYKRFIK